MAIRLIASDLDETLLNKQAQLTERTLTALKRAMAAGAYVALASGRMVRAMESYARQIGVNAPMIAFNGALTQHHTSSAALDAREISAEDARHVAQLARARKIHIQAFTRQDYFFERHNDMSALYARGIGGIGGHATGLPLDQWIKEPLCKLLMIADPADVPGIVKDFTAATGGRVAFAASQSAYIECTAAGVNKGVALSALALRLGVAREETAAFGDGDNDLEMLRWAGHGYAVANARPDVRKVALSAPPSHEDGVAQIIEGLLQAGRIAPAGKD